MSKKSVCKNLNDTLGGNWTHVPFSTVWNCDDGRHISGTSRAAGLFDDDDFVFAGYYLYEQGKPAVDAYSYMYPDDMQSINDTLNFL